MKPVTGCEYKAKQGPILRCVNDRDMFDPAFDAYSEVNQAAHAPVPLLPGG